MPIGCRRIGAIAAGRRWFRSAVDGRGGTVEPVVTYALSAAERLQRERATEEQLGSIVLMLRAIGTR